MNSNDVLKKIEEIAATSSRSKKEEILLSCVEDDFFRLVLKYCYDSFITFGITPPKAKIGKIGIHAFDLSNLDIFTAFDDLASRKVTGSAAKDLVQSLYALADIESAELIWRILSKDLRCGITAKTVNSVLPGTIPTFNVMLAHKFEGKHIKAWPVAVEPKLDGVRVICLVKDGKAQFFSRTGKPFPAVEHMGPGIAGLVQKAMDATAKRQVVKSDAASEKMFKWLGGNSSSPCVALDGEIVSGNFNKTVGDVRRKEEAAEDATYTIFDALPYREFTSDTVTEIDMTYIERRVLAGFICLMDPAGVYGMKLNKMIKVNNEAEVQAAYAEYRAQGLEGAVVKPLDGIYTKKRSRAWLKCKAEETEDLVVTGAFEGQGKYEGMLGGLICDRKGIEVRVGGGFSDSQRQIVWNEHLMEKERRDAGQTQLYPRLVFGRMIEIEFHEVTPDGSLRHPRFIGWRDDKHDADAVA